VIAVLSSVTLLLDIGRSLREGFFMFWETLWPLVLGFGLSGAVQAFVSRESMRRRLGDHRPPAVARATAFGMLSSSCSYAASAMSKSIFTKGADFVAVNVFMFASTNLVVELGVVLVVLMGWQFAVSEFVGGFIMIVLLTMVGGLYLRGKLVVAARERLTAGEAAAAAGGHHHGPTEDLALQQQPWHTRLRSKSGWADASTFTMADLTMVRRELLIGYTVAGFLAVVVPIHVWNAVFFHGHGVWTSIENAIVGPLVALASGVCSVGNVPLAAALWHGGIAFGGVISFLFADLIAFPILLIYRRFYGTRLMLRMLIVFWGVMSVAGLLTEVLFRVAGLVPANQHTQVVADHFAWNYTTYLNIVFLALFGLLYWTYRHRDRLGAGEGGGRYALDPVCGMQVEKAHAPAALSFEGAPLYFCSDRCRGRFEAQHGSVTGGDGAGGDGADDAGTSASQGSAATSAD
jgi:uncharacterized membrane protein YraQ (UPF0718 family)/YHS domain-containing protein